jgi:hypothetical protein
MTDLEQERVGRSTARLPVAEDPAFRAGDLGQSLLELAGDLP